MSSAATRRLIKELSAYNQDPNPALDNLQLQSEDDLFIWLAVLRGPVDTPYEGELEVTKWNIWKNMEGELIVVE